MCIHCISSHVKHSLYVVMLLYSTIYSCVLVVLV